MAQIVEAVKILRGDASFKLKREPRRALTHSIGGFATNNFVTIVERTGEYSHARNFGTPAPGFRPPHRSAGRKVVGERIADEGEIETFTIVHVTPDGFLPPLPLALIRDRRGARILAQGDDTEQLEIGRTVYLRRVAGIYYFTVKSHLRTVREALKQLLRRARH